MEKLSRYETQLSNAEQAIMEACLACCLSNHQMILDLIHATIKELEKQVMEKLEI